MKREIVEGKIQGHENGYAFLLNPKNNGEDYFIPHGDLRGAMHGDFVLCQTTDGEGQRTTARVLKVVERGISELVGTYFTCKSGGFVVPDDKKFFCDIYIPFGKGLKCNAGDKVVCKILSYPKKKSPEGIVSKILGRQFEKKAELNSIAYSYNLSDKFNINVIKECESLQNFSIKGKEKRRDLSSLLTFTIDGESARDFDDAVSLEIENNNYKLGVHIADVSFYVKKDSNIDKEAFNRATSVYFPEKVYPMLPEKLCNDLCSLKEGVIRPTVSCFLTIDKDGNVLDKEFCNSYIKSCARLTYNQVQDVLDNKDNVKLDKKIISTIFNMETLSDILYKKREKKGCINFDISECEIIVDKKGKILLNNRLVNKSHKIIEEFMIAANVAVAEFMFYLQVPFVYRVHDKPTQERLENFFSFLNVLGVPYKKHKEGLYANEYQKILKETEHLSVHSLINRVMLRSMQKAKYSPEPLSHFGLAEEHYCHFTSPIRRYPDLVVHRILKDFLNNGVVSEDKYEKYVHEVSVQSSEKEKNAENAERAVDDYYKMLFLEDYIGNVFEGVISGVTSFGLFVEIFNAIEGLVKIDTLKGKNFKLNSVSYTLSNNKKSFRLGDLVKIKVVGVNIVEKKAEFLLIE